MSILCSSDRATCLALLLLIPLLSFTQWRPGSLGYEKDHVSIGLFDYKTGTSLIGYARTIYKTGNNEFFLGAGTMIAVNTLSIGVKRDLLTSSLNKVLYSSVSLRGVYGVGKLDDFFAPSISLGIDFPGGSLREWLGLEHIKWSKKKLENKWIGGIKKKQFMSFGISSTIKIENGNLRYITFPYFNMNYRW